MKFRKFFSTLSALFLLAGQITPVFAGDWYIEDGNITVNSGDNGQTVTQGTQVDVPDDNPVITQRDSDIPSGNSVTVNAEANKDANVTIENLNIDTTGGNTAAVTTGGSGNVNVELNGDNTLQSADGRAGVEKTGAGTLTINDADNNGSLSAMGGENAAGIGGGDNGAANSPWGNGSNINISGGNVSASGGSHGADSGDTLTYIVIRHPTAQNQAQDSSGMQLKQIAVSRFLAFASNLPTAIIFKFE